MIALYPDSTSRAPTSLLLHVNGVSSFFAGWTVLVPNWQFEPYASDIGWAGGG